MATRHASGLAKTAIAPSVLVLFLWMIVPLGMTIYFSVLNYNLLDPGNESFAGLDNYRYFLTDPAFFAALGNTLKLVGGVLIITVVGGTLVALLLDQPFFGVGIVRLMVIAPFFVMPTVSALIWKNLLMHPVSGLFAWLAKSVGLKPIDWFAEAPLTAISLIVAWQWLPFATLILLTALQSLDQEQKEAAEMDGTPAISFFFYIVLPHLSRAITVVILIETIFLLNVFAEILVTTGGGPGLQTTNIPFLVYAQALLQFDIGGASAGGIVAVDPRQHRGLLPRPHDRTESGGLSHGPRRFAPAPNRHDSRRLDRRLPHLLSDPVDGPDQLQDRAGGLLDAAEIPVLPLDPGEFRRSCRSAPTICGSPPTRSSSPSARPCSASSSPSPPPGPWPSRRASARRTCCSGCSPPR